MFLHRRRQAGLQHALQHVEQQLSDLRAQSKFRSEEFTLLENLTGMALEDESE
jgi:hypothetical protein